MTIKQIYKQMKMERERIGMGYGQWSKKLIGT